MAPTCGSAHGTTDPTARNFDCTPTPHSPRSRSQATIEYVDGLGPRSATSAGSRGAAKRRHPSSSVAHVLPDTRAPCVLGWLAFRHRKLGNVTGRSPHRT